MDWTTEEMWFNAQQGEEIYLFSKACRTSVVPTQPPIQRVLEALHWGQSGWNVKLTPHLQLSTELKNKQSYSSTPPHAFMVHTRKTLQVHNFCNINSLFNTKSISLNYLHSDIRCCMEMHLI
jgi:hypothetical protein